MLRLSRILAVIGFAALLIGAVDPLEGSFVILPGAVVVSVAAGLVRSRYRKLLYISAALIGVGVSAMVGVSAIGGLGGGTGLSRWWALTFTPYPVGWILCLVASVLLLRELFRKRT